MNFTLDLSKQVEKYEKCHILSCFLTMETFRKQILDMHAYKYQTHF